MSVGKLNICVEKIILGGETVLFPVSMKVLPAVYNAISLWFDIPLSFKAETTLKKFKKYLREIHLQTENL